MSLITDSTSLQLINVNNWFALIHFISLDPHTYYISFIDYIDYKAKVST